MGLRSVIGVSFSRIKNGDRSAANRFRALEEALPAPAHSMGPTRCLTCNFLFHDLNSKLWNRIKPDYFLSCLMLFVSGMEFWNLVLHFCILLQGVSNWHFFMFPLRCPRMVVCDLQLQMPGTAVLFWDERTKRDETAGWTPNSRGLLWHMWH